MAYDYDLFVIGAGSGGVRASRIAAGHGARVGICEDFRVGGTCVIRGCVPEEAPGLRLQVRARVRGRRGLRLDPGRADALLGDPARQRRQGGRSPERRLHPPARGGGREAAHGTRPADGSPHDRGRRPDDHGRQDPGGDRRRAGGARDSRQGIRHQLERGVPSARAAQAHRHRRRRLHRRRVRRHLQRARRPGRPGAAPRPRAARLRRGMPHRRARLAEAKRHHHAHRDADPAHRIDKRQGPVHRAYPARRHVRNRSRDVRHRPRAQHQRHRPGEGGRAGRQGGRHRRRRMVQDHGRQHLGGGRRHRPHQPHAGGADGRPLLRRHRVRQQAAQGRPSRRAVGRVLPARARQCRADGGGGQDAAGRDPRLHLGLQADEVHPVRAPAAHLHEADRRGRDRQGRGRAHGGRRCRRAGPGTCGGREGRAPPRRSSTPPSASIPRPARSSSPCARRGSSRRRDRRQRNRALLRQGFGGFALRSSARSEGGGSPFIHSAYRFTDPAARGRPGCRRKEK